jgi:RNA 3'-terminal phosphate cyclase (ATP)
MIHIDGSQGEGGGQILRSSLALSMATGQPFHITRIRAGRAKPGLMRQHFTCVQAAATICSAHVSGAAVGSQEVTFSPGSVRPGNYHFAIGTAGGTSLVLQAVLPALLRTDRRASLIVEGGTHNTHAPPFEFLERALLPVLESAGARVRLQLERHGFYPVGGGRVKVEIDPPASLRPIELLARGALLSAHAAALVSRLPLSIAQREVEVLRKRLGIPPSRTECIDVPDPRGPGNAAYAELRSANITEVFSGVGQLGKPAAQVAGEIADEAESYLAQPNPVGPYLADQLMVPLAMMAGGEYATGPLTLHSETNMLTIRAFGGEVSASHGIVHISALPC